MCRNEFPSLNRVEITPSLDEFLQVFLQLFAIGADGFVAHAHQQGDLAVAIVRTLSQQPDDQNPFLFCSEMAPFRRTHIL